jgi:hypothetical protein
MGCPRNLPEASGHSYRKKNMKPLPTATLALGTALFAAGAIAQSNSPPGPGQMPNAMPQSIDQMGSMPMRHAMPAMMPGQHPGMPTESGQAAFGAIQEIVAMLLADPATNWSKVDIDTLRQHLIDMDEVTLRAVARKEPIDNGLRVTVTGDGRTLEAIQRMVPAHAQDINGLYGWIVQTKAISNGEELTVTSANASDVMKIRALGLGIMVLGTHQMHHLAIAKGEMMHTH